MKRFHFGLFVVSGFIAALAFWGCSENTASKNITEGMIEFKAVPVDKNSSMAMMAPDKMTVKFKDNYSLAEMNAGMGALTMSFISDPKKNEFVNLVSFLGKHACVMNLETTKRVNHYLPAYTVEYPKEVKQIAGYECHKAILKFADKSPEKVVWFTKEISIKNPNWSNPYYQIDGVLMDYELKKYGLELHFTATTVAKATIDQSIFTCPSDYKQIAPEELDKMFQGFY
jgi:GLPGLI family protein